MSRKFWAFVIFSMFPLGWGIREVTKATIFELVAKTLENAVGFDEAKMIATISTYAIPLLVIVVSSSFAYHFLRQAAHQSQLTVTTLAPQRRLRCSFSKDIPRCVERGVVLTTWTPTRPSIQPPNTTLTLSEPSMFIAEQQIVVLYNIRVCAAGDDYIDECEGRLVSISRPDGSSDHLNVALPFAPFEELDANKKRIYRENPEYLNVFYITTDNNVRIKSHLLFPSGINQDSLFNVGEVHDLKIMVMAPDCKSNIINLSFYWTGDVNTATILEVG